MDDLRNVGFNGSLGKIMLPEWIPPNKFVITQEVIELFDHHKDLFVKVLQYLSKSEKKPLFITIDSLKAIDDKNLSDLILPIIEDYNPKFIEKSFLYKKKKSCTIAVAQIFCENENQFPFKHTDETVVFEKIQKLIKYLNPFNVDILCLPELTTSKQILNDLFLDTKIKIPVIIGGSFYDGNFNSCPIIITYLGDKKIIVQEKMHPSQWEDSCYPNKAMCKGQSINIISTDYGTFSVLLCLDGLLESQNLLQYCLEQVIDLDLIFVISKTIETQEFHDRMHELASRYRKYCIFSNAMRPGYSGVYSPLDRKYHDEHLEEFRYPRCKNDKSKCIISKPDEERVLIFNLGIHEKAESHPTKYVDNYSNIKLIKEDKWAR